VGQSLSCDFSSGSVFLWENGSMIDLNAFVPPGSGVQLAEVQAVNDDGEIAGDLLPPSCNQDAECGHAFVLIPCHDEDTNKNGCEEGGQGAATAIQHDPSHSTQSSTLANTSLTPRKIAAKMRARFGRNRAFGLWQHR
jgi:hypothetical protein